MMTKNTSAKMAFLKGASLLLLMTAVVIVFGHRVYAQSVPQAKTSVPVFQDKKSDAPKQAASQSIVDEYNTILRNYNQEAYHLYPMRKEITPQDKARLKVLFLQMNQQQRDKVWIKFIQGKSWLLAETPPPTEKQMADWQNAKTYGVWINDKRIANAKLADHKPSDFNQVMISNLTPLAQKNDGFVVQVGLMTKAYYAKYKKETLADTAWHMVVNQSMFGGVNKAASKDVQIAIPRSQLQVVPPAANPASQAVVDQYGALLNKYQISGQTISLLDAVVRIPKNDRLQMQNLFNQMNYAQQQAQPVLFGPLIIAGPAQKPTQKNLDTWAAQSQRPVFINGKYTKGAALLKHKPEEFANFNYGGIFHGMNELNGGIYLMTPAYYEDDTRLVIANHIQLPMVNDKLYAGKEKQSITRETRKKATGVEYDHLTIRTNAGSRAEVDVSHNGRVGFFIDSTYYDELAITRMTQKYINLPIAVAVQEIRQKDHPNLNLHGYEAVFIFITYPDKASMKKVMDRKWIDRIPEIAAELKNQRTL